MCIVFLWRRKHGSKMIAGSFKLVIAANRDEFFHRPAKDADFWDEDKNIIGGEKNRIFLFFYALLHLTVTEEFPGVLTS